MNSKQIFRELMSMILAAALFLHPVLSVNAEELPQAMAAAAEEVEATEFTEPPETTAAAEAAQSMQPPETTEAAIPTEPAVVPEELEAEETTEATEAAAPTETSLPDLRVLTLSSISQALGMEESTEGITIRGTVVFADGTRAVLQQRACGICLFFASDPGLQPGDVLQVTGTRNAGLAVAEFEVLGTDALPAVEAAAQDVPENVRVLVEDAVLGEKSILLNGAFLPLAAELTEDMTEGSTVNACGVLLDGCFYADTLTLKASSAIPSQQEWNTYFGRLHAHTEFSDGTGGPAEAFDYAANVEGLDFLAITDHSDSFVNGDAGAIRTDGTLVSTEWSTGKAAAEEATDETFVGIFGYEMSWAEGYGLGHISTFNTPGWQTWLQPGFDTLTAYYDALTSVPASISQFNHSSHDYGSFQGFTHYSPQYDAVMRLLEIGSENDPGTALKYYTKALEQGWHLAPVGNHSGDWNDGSPVRTVVLAKELTEDSIYDAMAHYRVYATRDSDLEIHYRLNGYIMGSIIGPADSTVVSVYLNDPTDAAIGTVEVIANDGTVVASRYVEKPSEALTIDVSNEYSYYYLRITQPDGDLAVTAPVWVDSCKDMGIRSFESDVQQPMQEQEITLTLELYNNEQFPFVLGKIEFTMGDTVIHQIENPGTVAALGSLSYSFPFMWAEPGAIQILATVTGTVADQSRTCTTEPLTLRYQAKEITVSTISDVRSGIPGTSYRIKGRITAGNSKSYNSFPNTLYLQDDTGGIAVTGCTASDIELGTSMEVTGVLRQEISGELVLELTDCSFPDEIRSIITAKSASLTEAMNYAAHGGELLEIVGTVVYLGKTDDNSKGISWFTLRDTGGSEATVIIEDGIGSSTYATNELASVVKKGRTIRAKGLVYKDNSGETVLRVRDCAEVVYVAPVADPSNPKTGDRLFFWK